MAKDKDKPKGKDKKAKKGQAEVSETAIRVSAHPRATYAIARIKGIGGLIGLVLVAFLSWRAGVPAVDVAPARASPAAWPPTWSAGRSPCRCGATS